MWLLVHEVMAESPINNLGHLWKHIYTFQNLHREPHRFRYLNRLSMFVRKQGAHKLRGKAAELKGLGPALLSAWLHFAPQDDNTYRKITLMLKLNCSMEQILNDNREELSLPEKDAKQFKVSAFGMCQLQLQLQEHHKSQGNAKLFSVSPKCHFLCHIASLAGCISPRQVWCFLGEDAMRRVQTVARACSRRVGNKEVTTKMLRRIRISMHLLYSRMEDKVALCVHADCKHNFCRITGDTVRDSL